MPWPSWVESLLKRKWVQVIVKTGASFVPGAGPAVDEGFTRLQERQDKRSLRASLLDLEEHAWRPDASPAALLRADFGVVPFHGRTAELQSLARWCEGDQPLALRLYMAPGGFGKTRLLRHFVRARRDEWDAGFLPEKTLSDDEVAALFGEGKRPLLLVLDYAESRRSQVEAVVLAARDTSRPRVRVVLLARAEGDWWSELKRAGDGVGDFFQGPAAEGPIPLPPLTDSVEARLDSFRNAVRAFAKVLGKEPDVALSTAPPLDHEDFERVLLVHAAALAAVEGEQVPWDKLLDWLLTRETRGIDRVREKHAGLGPEIQRATYHAAALLTLAQGADSRDETVEIISRAPGLSDQPRARREQVAEILHVLYHGRRWCDGVEPDLVGEHLAAWCLHDAPELLDAAFGDDSPEPRLEAGLTVLNRLAQRRPADRRLLEAAIGRGLQHLALPAVRVAVAGGDPIGFVLADALSRDGDPEIARRVEEQLPYPTTSLLEVAVQVGEMLHRDLKDHAVEPAELARRSSSLSIRLADVGRREEALEAIREAVDTYRRLADAQPDAFRPNLAMSLTNLSIRLAAVGRREEALEAIREAVDFRRGLADARPDAFRSDLAMSLNSLSNRLADVGRREEALEAIREAAETYRGLADARPDAFRPDLASSLNNLSIRLAAVGRREEALEAIREAVETYRGLADASPDAFRPDLASSLNNLSIRLAAVGRREEALEAIREAVQTYRGLADARPDAFRPDLASSLNNLSIWLAEVGRREEALEAIREAVQTYGGLADARPDAFRPDLAMSLNNLSNRLAEVGRREEALEAVRKGVETYRGLADVRPDAFRPDLAASLNNLSIRLADAGRREEALEAILEAVDIRRGLADARPNAFRPNLATSLNNLSIRLADAGRREEALEAILEAVDIRRGLADVRPDAFRPDLASSLNNLSNRLADIGRHEEALEAIREAVGIYRGLADTRPAAFRPNLAMSLNNLSSRLADVGRREEALEAVREAVVIRRGLADARPDVFRPDLATSLGLLQVLLRDAGHHESALEAAREALDLLEPIFSRLPRAYAGLMKSLINGYEQTAAACGVEPDRPRLRRIEELLAGLWEE